MDETTEALNIKDIDVDNCPRCGRPAIFYYPWNDKTFPPSVGCKHCRIGISGSVPPATFEGAARNWNQNCREGMND